MPSPATDADNRLTQVDGTPGNCSTATACYVYDALGRRVEKIQGANQTHYWYDSDGNVRVQWNQNSVWMVDYLYLNGQLVAQYSAGLTYWLHGDHLGSTRLVTGVNQAVVQNLDYLPFGELNSTDSAISTHEFTGDERDAETSLDHTQFRQYSSQFARWTTPDPLAGDIANPQSLNRYTYVLNNPCSATDPLGLCDAVVGGFKQTPGAAGTQTQQDFANSIGANEAFPFSGLGGLGSFLRANGALAATVTRNAILSAAAQSGNAPFNIYAFSGGAQEVANVWSSLPRSVQSNANVIYISPGRVPFGSSLPPGSINQGTGPADSFLTALSPSGGTIQCGHNANCEFGALWAGGVIAQNSLFHAPKPCKKRGVFTRQNPTGGGGGGGRSYDPGSGYWDSGGFVFICSPVGESGQTACFVLEGGGGGFGGTGPHPVW